MYLIAYYTVLNLWPLTVLDKYSPLIVQCTLKGYKCKKEWPQKYMQFQFIHQQTDSLNLDMVEFKKNKLYLKTKFQFNIIYGLVMLQPKISWNKARKILYDQSFTKTKYSTTFKMKFFLKSTRPHNFEIPLIPK